MSNETMLENADFEKIKELVRKLIREEFVEALFREITVNKTARGPGEPEKVIETTTKNVLDALVHWLPYTEGALRGTQEDVNKATNKMNKTFGNVNALRKTIGSLEKQVQLLGQSFETIAKPMITLTRFVVALKETGLLEQMEKALLIEHRTELVQLTESVEDESNTRLQV